MKTDWRGVAPLFEKSVEVKKGDEIRRRVSSEIRKVEREFNVPLDPEPARFGVPRLFAADREKRSFRLVDVDKGSL